MLLTFQKDREKRKQPPSTQSCGQEQPRKLVVILDLCGSK
jgi:hypothetical protein